MHQTTYDTIGKRYSFDAADPISHRAYGTEPQSEMDTSQTKHYMTQEETLNDYFLAFVGGQDKVKNTQLMDVNLGGETLIDISDSLIMRVYESIFANMPSSHTKKEEPKQEL